MRTPDLLVFPDATVCKIRNKEMERVKKRWWFILNLTVFYMQATTQHLLLRSSLVLSIRFPVTDCLSGRTWFCLFVFLSRIVFSGRTWFCLFVFLLRIVCLHWQLAERFRLQTQQSLMYSESLCFKNVHCIARCYFWTRNWIDKYNVVWRQFEDANVKQVKVFP